MARLLYSVLLYLLSPLLVLYLAQRAIKSPDYRGRWGERFGFKALMPTDILIHSVSMGETLAAIPLIRAIMAARPNLRITVTTSSPTGSAEVIKAFGDRVQHCYLPFDLGFAVNRFLNQLGCAELIIMETELWPNLIAGAKARGVKVSLLNARLSEKSAASYQKFAALTVPMLKSLDQIAVQTAKEAERFVTLGVDASRVHVCGSLKFDIQIPASRREAARQLRQRWGRQDHLVWVAGSVHPGEFDTMLSAHRQLLELFPEALLIMVPRHPEQFANAARAIRDSGFKLALRSEGEAPTAGTQVLLGDTMGELLTWYGAADMAFVGGTLVVNGGHNPLEPAAMGLPVAMGPNHWDFKEITQLLQRAGNLTLCANPDAFNDWLLTFAQDTNGRALAGEAGLRVVESNRGALSRQLAVLGYAAA
ncbi:lipid IV(A) 3-deoxy-D-manno-octulosonic acid transferase [Shewanella litorisediminis]|uniref:3-deoxy-D-manno-octulosonic acid transferase n=1 Tax=Shewanella litorisediminis TaxID=1173586 RepID=A0ABX7G886_9GAMM|nr:lipid IV(A) 3-deoxy-D-manno-octulosonic acid transferase [Shewanella litorisediminis]MCL2919429.1 lipid IV(A) 3-deoxy-D-manno-octulosonic acid transferase [Shewanella litorisediminis]QRH03535.1 lipid IV(A) 3-deoxy-D-manno-octulosonic acid transferase [Shewanella litorisediminis]